MFLGRSQAILRVLELIDKAARSSSTVLIIGESGVGKDVAPNEIHRLSGRTGRYLPKNCAAFGEGLIESELFGHERGAFTSAVDRRPGIFEPANGGTVFLDEITEMKLELQAKLLRVLEEREVTCLGGHTPIPVNVRVIAASNRPMQEALALGKLRPDLYYRLKVFQIAIPPLRERLEDLELVVVHFIEEINREQSKDVEGPDNEALALLKAHTWPGNVREFRNVIEQAVVMREHGRLTPRDLPDELCNGRPQRGLFCCSRRHDDGCGKARVGREKARCFRWQSRPGGAHPRNLDAHSLRSAAQKWRPAAREPAWLIERVFSGVRGSRTSLLSSFIAKKLDTLAQNADTWLHEICPEIHTWRTPDHRLG
jgi:transcriptional regulator with PAS, ATPase and Fis domain